MINAAVRRIARKELRLFFQSPVAWLFLASFSAVTLFIFFWVETYFARNVADLRPLFKWMPVLLIFLCSALTMRMWSDERRNHTLEHCHSLPVSLRCFVLGKFLACLALLVIALATTLPLAITVDVIAQLDRGPVVAAYLACILLGAAYLSAGLFVSALTDNAVVSLMGACALCAALYLIGSPLLTAFFSDGQAETLRLFGSGARFDSIVSGVIDLRDILYYASLTLLFLSLNVFWLTREGWAAGGPRRRQHRQWWLLLGLISANLLFANWWLTPIKTLRLDVTAGKQHSLSPASHEMLSRLREPLLIRAYLSERTHPLLSPLVPRLRDLLAEYELVGADRVKLEIIDPTQAPLAEREANERFGIYSTPFQISDRHQTALVNAYFNVLVQYGDEHRALGFSDLIEVHAGTSGAEVQLRNPEYEVTRAIREVLQHYRAEASLFDGIQQPVELLAYISGDEVLPGALVDYKQALLSQAQELIQISAGKFQFRLIDPQSDQRQQDGRIAREWGFKPMVSSVDDEQAFYFYLALTDGQQVLQLPSDNFDPENLRSLLKGGLKRFSNNLRRTVALVIPHVPEAMQQHKLGGPTFRNLERAINRDYAILAEDLSDGAVSAEADILAVLAPQQLSATAVFAIDQFLMRGGTVVLATSPYTIEIAEGKMRRNDWPSGLQEWLAGLGVNIGPALVLDQQGAPFPTPIKRRAGEFEFDNVQVIDNPYLPDLRGESIHGDHPLTANLPQVTMAWPSPIELERRETVRYTPLLQSSAQAWRSRESDITPQATTAGVQFADSDKPRKRELLAVLLQGHMPSAFTADTAPQLATTSAVLPQSPDSARLIVFASNDFMDDQILRASVSAAATQYLGPLELFMNTLDWALQDDQLLQIRSRGHFNRALPAMDASVQQRLEYLNYAMALGCIVALLALHALASRLRRRRLRKRLAL